MRPEVARGGRARAYRCINPTHPIAEVWVSISSLEYEEMYGEQFAVPEPLETVFISWFQGGEVFAPG